MLADELEVGLRVVKRAFVDMYDLSLSPLVLGMTRAALLLANSPMVSGQILHIGGDITMVVTAHAHFILLVFIERLVTALAVFFEAGMGLGQVTRIDHDIVLLDASGSVWYEFGANDNITTGEGWEVLQYTNYDFLSGTTEFSIAITYDDVDSIDTPATLLKTVVFGSSTINGFPTNSSTLIFQKSGLMDE